MGILLFISSTGNLIISSFKGSDDGTAPIPESLSKNKGIAEI
jgi:hypothetical protein